MRFIYILLFFYFPSLSQENRYIDSVKNLTNSSIDTVRFWAYSELVWNLKESDKTNALIYAQKLLNEANAVKKKKWIAQGYNDIGLIYLGKGDFKNAQVVIEKSLQIREELGNKLDIASSKSKLANIYIEQTQYLKTIKLYHDIIKIYEELNNLTYLAYTYNNIAQVYNNLNDYNKSIYYLKKAEDIELSINDDYARANTLAVLASNYSELNKLDSSEKYFIQAKSLFKKTNSLSLYATTCNNLGRVYRLNNQTEKGIVCYLEAIEVSESIGDSAGVLFYNTNYANVLIDAGKYKEAEKVLTKNLEDAKRLMYSDAELAIYRGFVNLYIQSQNRELADRYFTIYNAAKDSIFSSSLAKQFSEAQTKFDVEKKDLELAKNKAEIESEKNKRYITYGALTIIIIVLAFVVLAFIQKRKNSKILEEKNKQLNTANAEITHQKEELHEKQTEILDSIHYAKRIQNALLTSKTFLNENFKNHFIFFKPKDIVSGDFYWATKYNNAIFFACCDSTGHGVPGAFVSLLNIGFLNEAVKEKGITEPGKIFDYVRMRLIETISDENQKDGFDGILIKIEQGNTKIEYTGANNNPMFIRSGELIHGNTNKMPVGKGIKDESFQTFSIELNENDSIYLFTDGFPDQFGGPKGKKFKYKQLEDLLYQNNSINVDAQLEILEHKLTEWKGNLEQIDDVCVVGIKL